MGFNLDFSGWKDMRKAQADSIINSAKLSANVIANRYGTYNKIISSVAGAAAKAYDEYKKKKEAEALMAQEEPEEKEQQQQQQEQTVPTGLMPEEEITPIQLMSAANKIQKQEDVNKKRAELIDNYMRYV